MRRLFFPGSCSLVAIAGCASIDTSGTAAACKEIAADDATSPVFTGVMTP